MNRRNFMKNASAGFALGGFMTQAYGRAEAIGPLAATALSETDRILVIVRLDGGNDGLNTLVNVEHDAYYQARPTLAIPKDQALRLTDQQGLHPELTGFKELFDEGLMSAVQGVGYPNPNRSHFRSTDIWMTASDSNEFITHGWLGRYLETQLPDPSFIPEHPLAIDIGPVLSLSLLGKNGATGMALRNPKQFFWLVDQGNKNLDDNKIPTPAGFELDFIRKVNFESLQYSVQIREAAEKGINKVEYPSDNTLASQMAMIAQLINGGMQTKVYLVRQGGYDTHANQPTRHSDLMRDLNGAVISFQRDLQALGLDKQVLVMTISEFGRRTKENGSSGTDHGTSAPIFLFGPQVQSGVHGNMPNFEEVDRRGYVFHEYHFRQVYASILNEWFGVSPETLNLVFPTQPQLMSLLNVKNQLSAAELAEVDFTGDGKLDFSDFLQFAQAFGSEEPQFDLDKDGKVGFGDFLKFASAFGRR